MKTDLIKELFLQFEQACYDYNGIECWSARELQPILGYARWENFANTIEKAKSACENAGQQITNHFRDVTKMVEIGNCKKIISFHFTELLFALFRVSSNISLQSPLSALVGTSLSYSLQSPPLLGL
jgi:hypothetical protein